MFLKNGLIVILVLSFAMNLMAIELFLLKSNDGDEKKYAFILTGRNGEDYGFIVKCPTPAQERSVLKSLFNNPHPMVERKNNLTYSDFNNAKKLDAGEFIRLCPESDNRESIDLFSDRTLYYMHFFESTDNSMYLTVKSKRVVKGFGLDPEKAQIVSKSYFKRANVLSLENGPEASNYHIDSKNEAIKIYVENDDNLTADVSVVLHLKSKSGKNDKTVVVDPLEEQSIYEKIFYECKYGNGSTCEIVIPYGQVIKKLGKQLNDIFEADYVEDIRFDNVVVVDREIAIKKFNNLHNKKDEKAKTPKEVAPVIVKKTKEQEIEQVLLGSNRHINTASSEIRIYPELDDTVKVDVEVTIQLKSKSGNNDRNVTLDSIKNVYIYDKQHYLCDKNTAFGCEIKIPFGDVLKKLSYQLNDGFEVKKIDAISFKNIVLVDKKTIPPAKPIVTPKSLVEPKRKPIFVPAPAPKKVPIKITRTKVIDMDQDLLVQSSNISGGIQFNTTPWQKDVMINNNKYDHAICLHTPRLGEGYADFKIPKKCKKVKMQLGICQQGPASSNSKYVKIEGHVSIDGRNKWSGVLEGPYGTVLCNIPDINVPDSANELRIGSSTLGSNHDGCHFVCLNPQFYVEEEVEVDSN